MSHAPVPAKPRGKGRPSKFTPETRRRLVAAIAKGLPFRHACAASGLCYASFCEYRNAHPRFQEQIERAVGIAIEKRLAMVEKAANLGDVASAKWLLEHLHPEHFAKSRIEVTGADGAPLAVGVGIYLPRKESDERAALPAIVTTDEPPR